MRWFSSEWQCYRSSFKIKKGFWMVNCKARWPSLQKDWYDTFFSVIKFRPFAFMLGKCFSLSFTIYNDLPICLVGFYDISTIVGYLMPNLLHIYIYIYIFKIYNLVWLGLWHINQWRLFIAKYCLCMYIKYIGFGLVGFYGTYIKYMFCKYILKITFLNGLDLLFYIQLNDFKHLTHSKDIIRTTTTDQSGSDSNGNKEILHIPQSSETETLLSDWLML